MCISRQLSASNFLHMQYINAITAHICAPSIRQRIVTHGDMYYVCICYGTYTSWFHNYYALLLSTYN
ncbi:MAG: hypothetical protein ACK55Z_27405, partial [bacterium]